IGPRIAGYLFAGGCFAYLVLAPAIKLVGSGLTEPFGFPAVKLIRDMSPADLRSSFVFYIGAGAVASAGILALARSLPTILIFFATVSSLICGQLGSSSNPFSGMTIAALLGTCLIFVAIGWTGVDHRVQAISIAAVVAVATANAGNTSQDLKTGFLVGSTPRRQQIAILAGALASALAVGWTLTLLNRAYTYPVPETHAAFSAQSLTPPPSGRAPVEVLPATMAGFRIAGGDSVDHAAYQVVRVYVLTQGVAAGKYLMDPATHQLRYVLDPGIGGR